MMKKWLSRHWKSLALIVGFYIGLLLFVGGITVFGLEPKYVDYFSNPEFQIYKIQEKYYEFSIPYKISNAKIDRMNIDCASFALLVYLNNTNANGNLTLNIPRKLLDYKIDNQDDAFFVLTDGMEVEYQEIDTNADSRTLWIPFEQSSKMIEIIASNVGMFPESGYCGAIDVGDSPYYNLMPPLKQLKSGISLNQIKCEEDLHLIVRSNDKPACVKPDSMPELFKRIGGFLVNEHPYSPYPDHN